MIILKKEKLKSKILYGVITLVACLGIGSAIWANYDTITVNGDYVVHNPVPTAEEGSEQEDTFGGLSAGPDVYDEIRFHNTVTGASLNVPLKIPSATSTAMTDMILGTYLFTEDVMLYNWGWGISESNDDWGFGSFAVGTTTLTSGSRFEPGVHSLTNSTTATIVASSQIATSTDDVSFDVWGYADSIYGGTGVEGEVATTTLGSDYADKTGGIYTRRSSTSPLFMKSGTVLVISCVDDCGATTTPSLGDAPNFKGFFYADIIYQRSRE